MLVKAYTGPFKECADVLLEPIMKKGGFFALRGRPTPFMNSPHAFKRSYLASQRSNLVTISGYMENKLQSSSAKQVVGLSVGRARHKAKRKGVSINPPMHRFALAPSDRPNRPV
jgi:hypothetical protein